MNPAEVKSADDATLESLAQGGTMDFYARGCAAVELRRRARQHADEQELSRRDFEMGLAQIQQAIADARTFIDTGSTFADNFRFGAKALAKLAAIENSQERNEKLRALYVNLIDETADDDLYELTGIGITEISQIWKLLQQMDENELRIFIEEHRETLISLNPTEEKWAEMIRNASSEATTEYNQRLEIIASALLGMSVTPWNIA